MEDRARVVGSELIRQDATLLPVRVVREAIVNALMDRSYRTHSPVQILRYQNRIEIRNPGHSLKSTDLLGEAGSECRNPRIAAVLHDVRPRSCFTTFSMLATWPGCVGSPANHSLTTRHERWCSCERWVPSTTACSARSAAATP